MKFSRNVLLALALSGALTVTAACGDKNQNDNGGAAPAANGSTSAAASPTADARAELTSAFSKLSGVAVTYTTTTDTGAVASSKLTGSSDPAKKANSGTMTITAQGQQLNGEVIVAGTDLYLKLSLPIPGVDPKKWMYIDGTKTSLSKLGLGSPDDPANVKGLADTIVSAERTGTGTYKGTIDATKRNIPAAAAAAMLQQMGDAAKSVPFEATVNAEGYVTSLTVKMPGAGQVPPSTVTSTFADFGKPVTISKPAATETQPAPAALLAQFA
ncbi:LppX_LprAFG lipoprotein [Dactylosporangium sp. NPDC049742]|uniref:LppX_LprAFG lipoprotein n=1 Tax=Dactylosporangium sp. NPDC049742 TaxID=3154737 RepID=UPI00342F66BD